MMRYDDQPIKNKLMLIIVFTSGLVLVLTSIAFVSYEWLTFRRSLLQNVSTLAMVVADNSAAAVAFRDPADAREVLEALKAEKNITEAAIYDQKGRLFAWYPSNKLPVNFAQGSEMSGYHFVQGHLVLFQPIRQGNTTYGTFYIAANLDVIYVRLKSYAQIVVLILLLSLFAAFVLSSVLQQRISRPILSLAAAARAISEKKDYRVRAEKLANDEIGILTQTFNQMLDQIQESDADLRKALNEKDVLIQEVHHRVKNNLQVILSLLDMQGRYLHSPEMADVFEDCKARIKSMSLVHEMLYGAGDFSKIDFSAYATQLVRDLIHSYSRDSEITTSIDMPQMELDIRKAVPLGLLLSEVVTNSLKHAFRNRNSGQIFVKKIPHERLALIAGDNGVGLPQSADLQNPKTFGLRIIRLLAEQLNADLTVDTSEGTVYRIQFRR